VATPNVRETCDAPLEPDAEEADPFNELDELEVVVVPEEDESSVTEDAVIDEDEESVEDVVVAGEPVVVSLEPAVLAAVEEVPLAPVTVPAVDAPAAPVAPVPDAAVEAPAVDAPVAIAAAPVLDEAVDTATEVPVGPVAVVVASFWAEVPAMARAATMRTWKTFMVVGMGVERLVDGCSCCGKIENDKRSGDATSNEDG
jgi:hypothetical protein